MEFITTLTKTELEELISDQVTKCLNEKLSPPQPESSDRCNLETAVVLTGLSKASIYKMVYEKRLPYMKFGSRLVFSKKQLTAWVEEHTLPPSNASDELNANLVRSAEKHLRNAI